MAVLVLSVIMKKSTPCRTCQGHGYVGDDECPKCYGLGFILPKKQLCRCHNMPLCICESIAWKEGLSDDSGDFDFAYTLNEHEIDFFELEPPQDEDKKELL